MPAYTVTTADARANFSRIANEVNKTGVPVTVFKNSRPWVVIEPANRHYEPNDETRAAMREADEIARKGARFNAFEDLMAALEREDVPS
ncbi:MAG: type II toxin-antitoxin system prevent-host-death family antitoxin [Coriobacteriales bacterium]|jgi:prevent-host-death family protein|nr:type II toxin-antitoxin system prevent-host-death family antitoxin [Coriobacteriales bacterium]